MGSLLDSNLLSNSIDKTLSQMSSMLCNCSAECDNNCFPGTDLQEPVASETEENGLVAQKMTLSHLAILSLICQFKSNSLRFDSSRKYNMISLSVY